MGARVAGLHVWVEDLMGMAVSIHVRSDSDTASVATEKAVASCFADLREIDRMFSTYRDDSDISRMARGELFEADADPRVAEVAQACREAEVETGGLFSAHWQGWFDPTGFVKGWAVERAARTHLEPLLADEIAVGINAGGDLQLFTAEGREWQWTVGISDPHRQGEVLATFDIRNGAMATSGSAERGAHIIDPHTGLAAARGVASASVVADSLTRADVWATAAVVAGFDERSWVSKAGTQTGMLVADDGRVTRWLGSTVIETVVA
ncbi:thiamine biosynthesis lipoprotein [Microbacterium endophyticum]|uniref:FAD:protein FMN transferase n=1 Tax=Microbacterium endophyticum TaxID=1526412 RepID=A0A7W4V1M6_9MICO|nr:FAD:protein FMN transferase [Microbacterium endophyticum]MBB2975192.1 thiamine biosynthesis lipoprotein [Microbacterium endophyticum]NIK37596.1 thiamine biosynthesis lipoprotein [Microbacterium endophyticum]